MNILRCFPPSSACCSLARGLFRSPSQQHVPLPAPRTSFVHGAPDLARTSTACATTARALRRKRHRDHGPAPTEIGGGLRAGKPSCAGKRAGRDGTLGPRVLSTAQFDPSLGKPRTGNRGLRLPRGQRGTSSWSACPRKTASRSSRRFKPDEGQGAGFPRSALGRQELSEGRLCKSRKLSCRPWGMVEHPDPALLARRCLDAVCHRTRAPPFACCVALRVVGFLGIDGSRLPG